MVLRIRLPNSWTARDYQEPLWNYLLDGGKRAFAIWHRRAGKDDVAMHFASIAAAERVANYWHLMPEYEQCRKALWNAVNSHTGMRRIDEAFPHDLRESTNDQQMLIRFKNGSTWQLVASDMYNSLMGSSAAGVTFSEWALSHPGSWGYIRPIIEENNGYALFITTPRGRNHAKTMYDMASRSDSGWFVQVLSADQTEALSKDQLAIALKEYITLYGRDVGVAQFEQEYMCNFNAAILGAYYALEMRDVRREGRVTEIEPDYNRPVHRCWDIGVDDDTAIWWFQVKGGQVFWLDCYGASGYGVDHYAEIIRQRRDKHGWKDGIDWVPPDARVREWGNNGRMRVDSMIAEGLNPQVVTDASKLDGISAARRTIQISVFHPRCEEPGLAALEQYQREWDDELKAFKHTEKRTWATHYADSFRYGSLAWRSLPVVRAKEPVIKGWVIPPPPDEPMRSGSIHL